MAVSFRVKNLRYVILGLLFLETILNYIDMQTLSVLAPVLTKELKMSSTDYAHVTQAFFIAFLIMFLAGGWIIDKIGVRRGMAFALVWWSIAEVLHAFAKNPTDLMVCRFLFGLAYPGAYLVAAKVIAEWLPASEKAFGTGVYTAGATIGATVAPPLIAWLTLSYGWRYVFAIAGCAGFIYVIVWLLLYREYEKHPWLSDEERNYIREGRQEEHETESATGATMWDVFRDRRFWAVSIGRMLGDNPWIFCVMWVPLFLNKELGLSIKDIGFLGWIPFLFSDLGSLGGGWISGVLVKRGVPALRARLTIMGISACLLLFTFTIGLASSTIVVIGFLSLMMFSMMAWMVNIVTIPVDAFPRHLVARVTGLTTGAAILGQIILTSVIGYCFEHRAYKELFALMSLAAPIAFVAVRLILGKDRAGSVKAEVKLN